VARQFGHHDLHALLLQHSPPKIRFFDAISRGERDTARQARDAGVTLDPADHGRLAMAIFHEKYDAARLMLELGFDANAAGVDGGTALHAAAWMGHVELVDAILRQGTVNVNQTDPTHHATPLGWALHGSTNRRAHGANYDAVIDRLASAGGVK
jgi:ankyrin repeat protein